MQIFIAKNQIMYKTALPFSSYSTFFVESGQF